MLFQNSKKLKNCFSERMELFKKLDSENFYIKNDNTISHLIKLIKYGFNDDEIMKLLKVWIESPLKNKLSHSKENFILFFGEKIRKRTFFRIC